MTERQSVAAGAINLMNAKMTESDTYTDIELTLIEAQ